jgi:hypothetical protein
MLNQKHEASANKQHIHNTVTIQKLGMPRIYTIQFLSCTYDFVFQKWLINKKDCLNKVELTYGINFITYFD